MKDFLAALMFQRLLGFICMNSAQAIRTLESCMIKSFRFINQGGRAEYCRNSTSVTFYSHIT